MPWRWPLLPGIGKGYVWVSPERQELLLSIEAISHPPKSGASGFDFYE